MSVRQIRLTGTLTAALLIAQFAGVMSDTELAVAQSPIRVRVESRLRSSMAAHIPAALRERLNELVRPLATGR